MSTFKPLLAHTIEGTSTIKYPCIVCLLYTSDAADE